MNLTTGSVSHRINPVSTADYGLPATAGGTPWRAADRPIVFGAPSIGEEDVAAVADCLRSKWIGSGGRVLQFEREFAAYKNSPYAAAVSSGTAAIHLALLALGVKPGDEVVAPAMTFASAIHSIVHAGATPVLADCSPTTFNMEPAEIERRITPRTRAILVVHMCGRCCDMDPIAALAKDRGVALIEDCAHAIESTYRGRPAGTIGDAGCFSFYATKNVTTGDGGMVLTSKRKVHNRVKVLSLHGLVGDAWSRATGAQNRYRIVAPGFKYNMTDIEAALGICQTAAVEARWKRRAEIWKLYGELLAGLPLELPPGAEPNTRHAYHLYTPLLAPRRAGLTRDRLVAALRAENIGAGIHYFPVHRQPYYRRAYGFKPLDFPNAALVGDRTFSLPLSPDLSDEDVADVCGAVRRIVAYYESGAPK